MKILKQTTNWVIQTVLQNNLSFYDFYKAP